MQRIPPAIDWQQIDTVLLDMDGTLLDRNFDDYFWSIYVPQIYAEQNNIQFSESKEQLFAMYKAKEGTLDWTDLDFWSQKLGMDIPAMKVKVDHLIKVHPFVPDFLEKCQKRGKTIYLVTNAHSKTLAIKIGKTAIGHYFDRVICSADIGVPKENPLFWQNLHNFIEYDPNRSILADDTEAVLESANQYGISTLIFVARPSSTIEPKYSSKFPSILYFKEILP